MFSSKRNDCSRIAKKPPPRDFRAEFNQVISQIQTKRSAPYDDYGGRRRLNGLEGPRELEVVCVKNPLKKNDTPAGMGFHFGSILGYSTEHQIQDRQHRVEIGEGRSDFAEMKRKLELNLIQSCRFKQHANIGSALKDTAAGMSGSDDHDDSDSARGRSASSSGSCHSANESISGSEVDEADSQQDPDEMMLDKFANECKISLSTAPMKPTVIHIDTPLKENFRDEEFIEANNDILTVDREPKPSDNVYEDIVVGSKGAENADSIDSSAVSAWLAKRGVVLEDCDAPRIVSVSRVEEKDDQIKVVKRRFLKHDPKRRRADNVISVSTDSQYSSDESTDAVKSSKTSACSEFSESKDTVILAEVDTECEFRESGERWLQGANAFCKNVIAQDKKPAPKTDQRISASSETEERSETVDLKSDASSPSSCPNDGGSSRAPTGVVVSRPATKNSFKAIRAQYDRHMAVEDDLIEVLPSVRRLAHMFRFEGNQSDLKNKYHSLTGRSLSKEFRQKQLRPKPSLPRSARFDEALPMEKPRPQLQKISELSDIHEVPLPPAEVKQATKSQKIQSVKSGSATVSGGAGIAKSLENKKKKSRSKAASCKGFFDREILARLSKFQQFI